MYRDLPQRHIIYIYMYVQSLTSRNKKISSKQPNHHELEKEQSLNFSRKKEIFKPKATEIINKTKSCLAKIINKIAKPLDQLTRGGGREKIHKKDKKRRNYNN